MSKYNKGDKFILEVDSEVYEGDMANLSPKYYTLKGLSGLAIIEESLDKLQKCETELSWDEVYIKGLEDAWEMARKFEKMSMSERKRNFGLDVVWEFFNEMTPQEALAKFEAYEKKQNEIKVGDVVFGDDEPDVYGIVTFVSCEMIYIMWSDGSSGVEYNFRDIKKTGKHIDINSVLEQLRGE